jgi:hypothetical protein
VRVSDVDELLYYPGSTAPYFDPGPYTRSKSTQCPWFLVLDGVRERVFYPELRAPTFTTSIGALAYLHFARYIPGFRNLSWVRRLRPRLPPCLTKIPLVRWDDDTAYLDVNHFITDKVLAPESGVLLHFKFLQDFHARALQEANRNCRGGSCYRCSAWRDGGRRCDV